MDKRHTKNERRNNAAATPQRPPLPERIIIYNDRGRQTDLTVLCGYSPVTKCLHSMLQATIPPESVRKRLYKVRASAKDDIPLSYLTSEYGLHFVLHSNTDGAIVSGEHTPKDAAAEVHIVENPGMKRQYAVYGYAIDNIGILKAHLPQQLSALINPSSTCTAFVVQRRPAPITTTTITPVSSGERRDWEQLAAEHQNEQDRLSEQRAAIERERQEVMQKLAQQHEDTMKRLQEEMEREREALKKQRHNLIEEERAKLRQEERARVSREVRAKLREESESKRVEVMKNIAQKNLDRAMSAEKELAELRRAKEEPEEPEELEEPEPPLSPVTEVSSSSSSDTSPQPSIEDIKKQTGYDKSVVDSARNALQEAQSGKKEGKFTALLSKLSPSKKSPSPQKSSPSKPLSSSSSSPQNSSSKPSPPAKKKTTTNESQTSTMKDPSPSKKSSSSQKPSPTHRTRRQTKRRRSATWE